VKAQSKGHHFKIANTGKSPIRAGNNVHTSSGAVQPAAYAHEMNHMNRILQKVTHIRPTKRG
jgi:hypothetical protein